MQLPHIRHIGFVVSQASSRPQRVASACVGYRSRQELGIASGRYSTTEWVTYRQVEVMGRDEVITRRADIWV